MTWQDNLVEDPEGILDVLDGLGTIAVLGIKTEQRPEQPAFYVPRYMQQAGFKVVPVPVYYPEVTQILGERVYRRVADVPGPVDMVNVFRRSQDVAPHVDDILAARPRVVWLQQGIRDDVSAEKLARAGIKVVQDACLMVDHRRWLRRRAARSA